MYVAHIINLLLYNYPDLILEKKIMIKYVKYLNKFDLEKLRDLLKTFKYSKVKCIIKTSFSKLVKLGQK